MGEQTRETYTAKWCEVDDCYKLSNGTEELADLFVCEESASHITASLNALANIPNPAAIGRVVEAARQVVKDAPDFASWPGGLAAALADLEAPTPSEAARAQRDAERPVRSQAAREQRG